jgi:transcriptional regulator with XRE-family HTH domain
MNHDEARAAVATELSRQGLTPAELARRASIDPATAADFLSGVRWPRLPTLGKIDQALGWPAGTTYAIANGTQPPAPAPVADTGAEAVTDNHDGELLDLLLDWRGIDLQLDRVVTRYAALRGLPYSEASAEIQTAVRERESARRNGTAWLAPWSTSYGQKAVTGNGEHPAPIDDTATSPASERHPARSDPPATPDLEPAGEDGPARTGAQPAPTDPAMGPKLSRETHARTGTPRRRRSQGPRRNDG